MAEPNQLSIKATDDMLRGTYSNALQISHTQSEVILDFINLMPPQAQLVSRVITSPAHAKQIIAALTDNLNKYETQFGAITPSAAPTTDFGFAA